MATPFQSLAGRLAVLKNHYNRSASIHSGKTYQLIAAEQLVVSAGTAWEYFYHQNFLRQAKSAFQRIAAMKKTSIEKSISERYGLYTNSRVRVAFPKRVSLDNLQNLLDSKGFNLVPPDKDFQKSANELLLPGDAQKYALSVSQDEFRNYFRYLRNYIAHKSKKSQSELVASLKDLVSQENLLFQGNLKPWNGYLPHIAGKKSRAIVVVEKLESLAFSIR